MCMPQPCHVNLPHPEHLHLKHLRTREARAYSSAKTHTHRNSASQHRAQRFREAWCGATRRRTGRVRACSARGCATLTSRAFFAHEMEWKDEADCRRRREHRQRVRASGIGSASARGVGGCPVRPAPPPTQTARRHIATKAAVISRTTTCPQVI